MHAAFLTGLSCVFAVMLSQPARGRINTGANAVTAKKPICHAVTAAAGARQYGA